MCIAFGLERLGAVNAELRLVQTELAKLTQSEAWWHYSTMAKWTMNFIGKMVVPLIIDPIYT